MPQSDHRGVSGWLRHRLTLIVYAEGLNAAREVLPCTRYDLSPWLHHLQEQALGTPALKWAISGECDAPLHAAAQLVQGLAVHLAAVPVVLIRLDTLGTCRRDTTDPWQTLNSIETKTSVSAAAPAFQKQPSSTGATI